MSNVAGGVSGGGLSQEQLRNAAIIAQVGMKLGASQRDVLIALITAYTESRLRNVNYGDRDSLGLFQQRAAWGSESERMDPYQSARMFFLGGHQGQRGLFDFKSRGEMGLGEAAQAVQVSAFPDRYAEALPVIRSVLPTIQQAAGQEVTNMDGQPYADTADLSVKEAPPEPAGYAGLAAPEFSALASPSFGALGAKGAPGMSAPVLPTLLSEQTNSQLKDIVGQSSYTKGVDGWRKGVVDLAKEYIGTPYAWGKASPDEGFDCSGIIQYVYGKLGIELPRVSYQQAAAGKRVGLNKLQPGDLVAWDNSSRNNGADHIAIYIGNGQILEAPKPGLSVRVRPLGESEGAWGVHLNF